MKKTTKKLLFGALLLFSLVSTSLPAQPPPPPPPGGHGTGGNKTVPIGNGTWIILGLAAVYGGIRAFQAFRRTREEA
jgi:hypothetical protein